MARKTRLDFDLVPDVRGPYGGLASTKSPISNRYRGDILRAEMSDAESILRAPITREVVLYFFPDVTARCSVDLDWVEDQLASIKGGRGCGQATFARLLPIFWRMPHLGWRASTPMPPWSGYDMAFRNLIRRADGSEIPYPRGTGPSSIPRPTPNKEAA